MRISVRELALIGIAGLCVSVGIAYLVVLISNPLDLDQSPFYRHSHAQWRWQEERGFGIHRIKIDPVLTELYYRSAAHVISVVNEMSIYEDNVESLPRRRPPRWSATRGSARLPSIQGASAIYWREEAYGWPFLSLRQQWILTSLNSQLHLKGGIDLGIGKRFVGDTEGLEKGLPLTVIWPGLIANVVVLTCSILILGKLATFARFKFRLSRKMCPSCAYKLYGEISAGCPECGWERDNTSTQTEIKET